jgi:hypothetical protein
LLSASSHSSSFIWNFEFCGLTLEDVPLQPPGFLAHHLSIDIRTVIQEYRFVDNDVVQDVSEVRVYQKFFVKRKLVRGKWWNMKHMINEITDE